MTARGTFVTIEGIDGSGKSTQARALASGLAEAGFDTVLTREPGGTEGAERIRRLLDGGQSALWSPESEALLFSAARLDHVEKRVRPALEDGKIVVCDRFVDSTIVYQGFGNDSLKSEIIAVHDAMIRLWPDLTFVLDLPVGSAHSRLAERSGGDWRLESFGSDAERLAGDFRALAAQHPERVRTVDSAPPAEAVAAKILEDTLEALR